MYHIASSYVQLAHVIASNNDMNYNHVIFTQPTLSLHINYLAIDNQMIWYGNSGQPIEPKLVKADFHGAIVNGKLLCSAHTLIISYNAYWSQIVVRGRCATFIGQSGIIIQETQNTFKIIRRDNQLICNTIHYAHTRCITWNSVSLLMIHQCNGLCGLNRCAQDVDVFWNDRSWSCRHSIWLTIGMHIPHAVDAYISACTYVLLGISCSWSCSTQIQIESVHRTVASSVPEKAINRLIPLFNTFKALLPICNGLCCS